MAQELPALPSEVSEASPGTAYSLHRAHAGAGATDVVNVRALSVQLSRSPGSRAQLRHSCCVAPCPCTPGAVAGTWRIRGAPPGQQAGIQGVGFRV